MCNNAHFKFPDLDDNFSFWLCTREVKLDYQFTKRSMCRSDMAWEQCLGTSRADLLRIEELYSSLFDSAKGRAHS